MNAPIIPIPRSPVTVRVATPTDLPFVDALQKRHAKQVGWMPTKQLEERIHAGHVLVAEGEAATPVGYCIACDRYMKREDCGIIYQMNVVPGRQRGLVGATLLRAQFERSAYGCRLYCCWCAQDIAANAFWESLGFVPLAFRAGSREKGRVHIFWQRRVRAGDTTTPYWFPSQTTGGAIREDRLVFPIPPGVGWREAMPIVLPRDSAECCVLGAEGDHRTRKALTDKRRRTRHSALVPQHARAVPPRSCISSGGLRFPAPKPVEPEPEPERAPKRKVRNDPKLVAVARELRDRYLEHVNTRRIACDGKYDVSRAMGDGRTTIGQISWDGPAALPAPVAPAA